MLLCSQRSQTKFTHITKEIFYTTQRLLQESNNAVEASRNEQDGQEADAPTGIHIYLQRVQKAHTPFTLSAITRKHDSDEPGQETHYMLRAEGTG